MGPQLPVIYLSDKTLIPGSSKWVEVRDDVRKALEDYGCFEVKYNGVSEHLKELKDPVVAAMEELFGLPVEAKKRNIAPKPYTGYMTHSELSESMGIQDPNILEKVHEFTQQLRPDCEANESMSNAIHKLSENLAELDVMIRRMIMESFGIDKYLDEHLNSTNYRLRLMKYIAPPEVDANVAAGDAHDGADSITNANVDVDAGDFVSVNTDDVSVISNGIANNLNIVDDLADDAKANASGDVVDAGDVVKASVNVATDAGVDANNGTAGDSTVEASVGDDIDDSKLGLHSHTDKNLITVIYQHEIEGLEVKTKDDKWIRIKPCPNSFVVLAGDSLYGLLNGRIHLPFHRVRVTEKKKTRYSIGLFSTPRIDYIIETPKELVDEKHPRVFKPFTYFDLMSFYLTEAGRRDKATLRAYCAISGGGAQSVF